MFEFQACELRKGDEFTDDDGENWHVVERTFRVGGSFVKVVCDDGYESELQASEHVVVK